MKDTWNRLFKEFDDFNRRMDDMFDDFMDISGPGTKTYGYTLYRGPDGVTHVREFGNPSGNVEIPAKGAVMEPFTDVTRENGVIRIVVELPGVGKDDINIDATEDYVSISVDTAEKRYSKSIALPCKVDVETAKAEYNNGILEVSLKSFDKDKTAKRISLE